MTMNELSITNFIVPYRGIYVTDKDVGQYKFDINILGEYNNNGIKGLLVNIKQGNLFFI